MATVEKGLRAAVIFSRRYATARPSCRFPGVKTPGYIRQPLGGLRCDNAFAFWLNALPLKLAHMGCKPRPASEGANACSADAHAGPVRIHARWVGANRLCVRAYALAVGTHESGVGIHAGCVGVHANGVGTHGARVGIHPGRVRTSPPGVGVHGSAWRARFILHRAQALKISAR
jgi:hypothetical protein